MTNELLEEGVQGYVKSPLTEHVCPFIWHGFCVRYASETTIGITLTLGL